MLISNCTLLSYPAGSFEEQLEAASATEVGAAGGNAGQHSAATTGVPLAEQQRQQQTASDAAQGASASIAGPFGLRASRLQVGGQGAAACVDTAMDEDEQQQQPQQQQQQQQHQQQHYWEERHPGRALALLEDELLAITGG